MTSLFVGAEEEARESVFTTAAWTRLDPLLILVHVRTHMLYTILCTNCPTLRRLTWRSCPYNYTQLHLLCDASFGRCADFMREISREGARLGGQPASKGNYKGRRRQDRAVVHPLMGACAKCGQDDTALAGREGKINRCGGCKITR